MKELCTRPLPKRTLGIWKSRLINDHSSRTNGESGLRTIISFGYETTGTRKQMFWQVRTPRKWSLVDVHPLYPMSPPCILHANRSDASLDSVLVSATLAIEDVGWRNSWNAAPRGRQSKQARPTEGKRRVPRQRTRKRYACD
jgi:hypothetical protein